jgi:hypothetical protein
MWHRLSLSSVIILVYESGSAIAPEAINASACRTAGSPAAVLTGWFEVRVDGPRRHHYRLFCRLDYDADDQAKPLLVVICGLDKPFRTELSDADYRHVRALGGEYLRRNPRSLA